MNILTLDYGTSSMRGILFDEKGTVVNIVNFITPLTRNNNQIVEQDATVWIRGTIYIIKRISEKNQIHAISITAFRSAIIAIDEDGRELGPCIMWQDKRNANICKKLEKYAETIKRLSGALPNTVFWGSRMSWMANEKDSPFRHANKYVTVAEYIIGLMTGIYKTDYTYGSRSNLMNLATLQWDKNLCDLFNIDISRLSNLILPGSIVGYTNKKAKDIFGCPLNIPVITAGGDQQCSAVGLGIFDDSCLEVNSGTGSFVIAQCSYPYTNNDAICNVSAINGFYILENNVMTSAAAFDWICGLFGESNFADIDKMIFETQAGSNGLICLPFFHGIGSRKRNANLHAAFLEISLNTTKKDFIRSVMEGIVIEISKNIKSLTNIFGDFKEIRVSGGLTKSYVFNQIQADVYGKRIVTYKNEQSTAIGAFVIAAKTLGIVSDYKDAFNQVRASDQKVVYNPNTEYSDIYQKIAMQSEEYLNNMRK